MSLIGSSEDADLIPIHSGKDWVAQLDDDLSQPTAIAGDSFRISALQREDPTCITLHAWISSGEFPSWTEVKGLHPELRSLWHHRNNLSLDDNGLFGGSGVHRDLNYNCSSLSLAGNGSSWLTMPPCWVAIWAGTRHWPA